MFPSATLVAFHFVVLAAACAAGAVAVRRIATPWWCGAILGLVVFRGLFGAFLLATHQAVHPGSALFAIVLGAVAAAGLTFELLRASRRDRATAPVLVEPTHPVEDALHADAA